MLCTILGTPSASQSLPTHHILSQVPEISGSMSSSRYHLQTTMLASAVCQSPGC